MPGMDGYEVCRRIKQLGTDPFIQVILVSGKGSVAERLRGYESMADDDVVKPFDHGANCFQGAGRVPALGDAARTPCGEGIAGAVREPFGGPRRSPNSRCRRDPRRPRLFAGAVGRITRRPDRRTLQRMREYALMLARELAVRGPYVDRIDAAFARQPVSCGPAARRRQVGIQDAVLLKPGRLTPGGDGTHQAARGGRAQTLESARDPERRGISHHGGRSSAAITSGSTAAATARPARRGNPAFRADRGRWRIATTRSLRASSSRRTTPMRPVKSSSANPAPTSTRRSSTPFWRASMLLSLQGPR